MDNNNDTIDTIDGRGAASSEKMVELCRRASRRVTQEQLAAHRTFGIVFMRVFHLLKDATRRSTLNTEVAYSAPEVRWEVLGAVLHRFHTSFARRRERREEVIGKMSEDEDGRGGGDEERGFAARMKRISAVVTGRAPNLFDDVVLHGSDMDMTELARSVLAVPHGATRTQCGRHEGGTRRNNEA